MADSCCKLFAIFIKNAFCNERTNTLPDKYR